jgi:hypothetical protein
LELPILAAFKPKLRQNHHSRKAELMQFLIVTKHLFQNTELFEATIDGLVTSTSSFLSHTISCGDIVSGQANMLTLATIPIISFSHFSWKQTTLQSFPENLDVRPFSTGFWSEDPHNVARLNVYADFIPHSSTVELVPVPFRIKGRWLINPKVCPVYSNLASFSTILTKSVLPSNL